MLSYVQKLPSAIISFFGWKERSDPCVLYHKKVGEFDLNNIIHVFFKILHVGQSD